MAIAAPAPQPEEESKPIPLKKKGSGLNQLIARTHKLGGQLLGLQITNGNLIAIFFSATQITAGIVVFAWIMMQYWALVLIPVCGPLAVLIERLSLGGLMVFRTASKEKAELEDSFHVKHIKKPPTEREAYEYKRRQKRLGRDRWTSGFLIVLGIAISGYVGDQFWARIFSPIGEPNSTILSILIASSVSLTFVFSELYAEPSNEGIKQAMLDNQISKAVLKTAEEDLQIELSMEAFGNLRSDPAKRAKVVEQIEGGMTTRLLSFAENAEYLLIGEEDGKSPKVQIREETQLLQLPALATSRREYEQCRDELAEMLNARPRKSRQKMADHFGIPKSTLQDWVVKFRREQAENAQSTETSDRAEGDPDNSEQRADEGQAQEQQDLQAEETPKEDVQSQDVIDGEVEELEPSSPSYADCRDELANILRDRPKANRQKLAEHFGVSKEILSGWIVQLRKEVQEDAQAHNGE